MIGKMDDAEQNQEVKDACRPKLQKEFGNNIEISSVQSMSSYNSSALFGSISSSELRNHRKPKRKIRKNTKNACMDEAEQLYKYRMQICSVQSLSSYNSSVLFGSVNSNELARHKKAKGYQKTRNISRMQAGVASGNHHFRWKVLKRFFCCCWGPERNHITDNMDGDPGISRPCSVVLSKVQAVVNKDQVTIMM